MAAQRKWRIGVNNIERQLRRKGISGSKMAARQLGGAERQNLNQRAKHGGGNKRRRNKMAASRINGSIKRGVSMTRSSA
jgi:hypothetical protein